MIKKRFLAGAMALAMSMMMITGCASGNGSSDSGTTVTTAQESTTQENKQEETTTQTVSESASETTTDTTNETEAQQEKVVASSVAVVQILDALGIPMVGVPTSIYELPESVADAARIGNPMSPDMEVITSLEPDVIVSVDSLSDELKDSFEGTGAESVFVNLSSYDGLKESINQLGERFGAHDKAAEVLEGFDKKEAEVEKEIEGKEGPSVLIIFGAGSSFMVCSEDTYVGDLAKRVGAVNIIQDAPAAFSPVDMEYLASCNPEYILFMAHANPEESLEAFKTEFESNEAWQNFDAVKNDKVIALPTGYFGMSANLQAADALWQLVTILYGTEG